MEALYVENVTNDESADETLDLIPRKGKAFSFFFLAEGKKLFDSYHF